MKILFQDETGNLTKLPTGAKSAPVVEVVLNFDRERGTGPRHVSLTRTYLALIDTGADFNYIDPSVLLEQSLPVEGTSTTRGATGSMNSSWHMGHLFFPEHGIQFETDFMTAPLRETLRNYDLVIGRLVLQRSTLIMDYLKQDFRLEFSNVAAF